MPPQVPPWPSSSTHSPWPSSSTQSPLAFPLNAHLRVPWPSSSTSTPACQWPSSSTRTVTSLGLLPQRATPPRSSSSTRNPLAFSPLLSSLLSSLSFLSSLAPPLAPPLARSLPPPRSLLPSLAQAKCSSPHHGTTHCIPPTIPSHQSLDHQQPASPAPGARVQRPHLHMSPPAVPPGMWVHVAIMPRDFP